MIDLNAISIELIISPGLLWAVLGIIMILFLAISAAFVYHWKEYALNVTAMRTAMALYALVSAVLVGISIISLILYTMSVPL